MPQQNDIESEVLLNIDHTAQQIGSGKWSSVPNVQL